MILGVIWQKQFEIKNLGGGVLQKKQFEIKEVLSGATVILWPASRRACDRHLVRARLLAPLRTSLKGPSAPPFLFFFFSPFAVAAT
jgi:hypothetical protein